MLLVPTRLGPSPIHGVGVFATTDIAAHEPVWRFEPGLDLAIPFERIPSLPDAFRAYLDTYAYASPDCPGAVVLSCDHAKFLNHSDDPNLGSSGLRTSARHPIAAGEELTCDYRQCCSGWTGFGDGLPG